MKRPVDAQTPDAEQLVREWLDVAHAGEYSRFDEYVSESYVLYEAPVPEEGVAGPQGEAHGPEGVAEYMRLVHQAFSDMEISIARLLAAEDVVMYEGTMSYTWSGARLGIPPTGDDVEVPFMEVTEIADGKIEAQRSYMDRLDIQEQMGIQ